MGISFKGFVLEPPRIGAYNSPYTYTPNVTVLDEVAYTAHFNATGDAARVDYFVTVIPDGVIQLPNGHIYEDRFLRDAHFAWTKNEGTPTVPFDRFYYDDTAQSYKLLPGKGPETLGIISADLNTARLKITLPVQGLSTAPLRLSCGAIGSGTTLTLSFVGVFGTPPAGTVEVLLTSGELHWNTSDLTTYEGQIVRFQQQAFFQTSQSDGLVGTVSEANTVSLMLTPIPATGQYPMLRMGRSLWFNPIEVVSDAALTTLPPPSVGSVYWSRPTGLLRFNPTDLTTYATENVYYDGVFMAYDVQLPSYPLGTVNNPDALNPVPSESGDIILSLPTRNNYQFETIKRLQPSEGFTTFGLLGTVELKVTGELQFSLWDRILYGNEPVTFTSGDLPIEHGIGLRFFRNMLNPTASSTSPGDLSLYWNQSGDNVAILAKPIMATPYVSLPALPIKDASIPLVARIEPGTGTFTGLLPDLSVANPPDGPGCIFDFTKKQLRFANRKNNLDFTLVQGGTTFQLPDPLLIGSNYQFELEVAPTVGMYQTLVENEDYTLDKDPGVISLTRTSGGLVGEGVQGNLTNGVFKDVLSSLHTQAGDVLIVLTGSAKGVYRLLAGAVAAGVGTDLDGTHLVTATNFTYEVRRTPEVLASHYWKPLSFPDPNTRVERIRSLGPVQNDTTLYAGAGTFSDVQVYQDVTVDFLTLGIAAGDTLRLASGSSYVVIGVEQTRLTLQSPVMLAGTVPVTVYRRLRLPFVNAPASRFRFGESTFTPVGSTQLVARDIDFTTVVPGQVQLSQETGNLNFSVGDLNGSIVYWCRTLDVNEYRIKPELSFIDFRDRFVEGEEALITYVPLDSQGNKLPLLQERVSFEILKEQAFPTARTETVTEVYFNPTGRFVADNPAPRVFRGSRPQTTAKVSVDTNTSTVRFLSDLVPTTDDFPHGESIAPNERIYVDYNVYQALGGEQNVSLLNPMYVAKPKFVEYESTFTVDGDQRNLLPSGYHFRIESKEAYQIGSSVFDSTQNQTTFTLTAGQYFADNYDNPQLHVVSVSTEGTNFRQPLLVSEVYPYQAVARGMSKFKVFGDRTKHYTAGVLVTFQDVGVTFSDCYLVLSAKVVSGWTEVTLSQNARRQYQPAQVSLRYTERPILEDGAKNVASDYMPVLYLPVRVFRKTTGQAGSLLTSADYTLDSAGAFAYKEPIGVEEEICLCYTGGTQVEAGTKLRYSYTHGIVPSGVVDPMGGVGNGLLGQLLTLEYTLCSPDTFYFRVENLPNFQAEVAAYFRTQAQGSASSSGPMTSNTGADTSLPSKGRESVFFTEGHLANMDLVARQYLRAVNDNINHLEDALQSMDGRVVGSTSGRFKFDGKIDNPYRETLAEVTNHIDDKIRVLPGLPFFPWIPLESYYRALWLPSYYSRIYPEIRETLFGKVFVDPGTVEAGTIILDFGQKDISTFPSRLYKRYPRALIIEDAASGTSTLKVDTAFETDDLLRPAFKDGMKVNVLSYDGTELISNVEVVGDPPSSGILTVTGVSAPVPRGSTVVLSDEDTEYYKNYHSTLSVAMDAVNGVIRAAFALFPGLGGVWGQAAPPDQGEILQMDGVGILNKLTAPFRFPALDGKTITDSSDTGIPMQGKTFQNEITALEGEAATTVRNYLDSLGGHITTTDEISSVNISGATLTRTGGWPSALPPIQLHDLVRVVTGNNSTVGWRRVIAKTATTLTVDTAFPQTATNATIMVTASLNVAQGTGEFPSPLALKVLTGSVGNIQPGHTIIFYDTLHVPPTHPNHGKRRQVRSVTVTLLGTFVTFDKPVVVSAATCSFRVSNHLATYDGWNVAVQPDAPVLSATQEVLKYVLTNDSPVGGVDSEVLALRRFLDGTSTTYGVLTDLVAAPRTGLTSGSDLTDPTFDYSGVSVGSFVMVTEGDNRGFYQVDVVTPHTLTVTTPFPVNGSVTFRVVSAYGISLEGLKSVYAVLGDCEAWATAAQDWISLVTTSVSVSGTDGPNMYASHLTTPAVQARYAAVDNRLTVLTTLPGPIDTLEALLTSREQYYNKRYIWIDGRTNVKNGFLFMKDRAVATRIERLEQQKKDLIKLASVE